MIDYVNEIKRLKKEKNAIILAHYYQIPEIQDIADYLGDSLALSKIAMTTDADIIVFCGVHFMAETAKILNPNKKVLLPVMKAGCKMADMINKDSLKKYKDEHPNTKIITYVNSTAEVKALSDCICTSTNGVKIIKHYLDNGYDILYCPDQNLGKYAMKLLGHEFEVWDGCCPIHHFLPKEKIAALKNKYPNSKVIAHPECKLDVLELADYIGSTKQLIEFVKTDYADTYIVLTEKGVIHQMEKENPNKKFILGSNSLSCVNMKMTKLEDVYNCLENETNEIILDEEVRKKALVALNKMMELS